MGLRFVSSTVLALLVATAAAACSNEGEGEPCSTLNGNDDCDDNLECVTPPNKSATNAPTVCCPVPPAQPTTPECSTPTFTLGDGSTAAPEASTMRDGQADGATDAATDASSDSTTEGSTSEAAAEAATDGPTSTDAAADGASSDASGQ